jgi:hypothetical protein
LKDGARPLLNLAPVIANFRLTVVDSHILNNAIVSSVNEQLKVICNSNFLLVLMQISSGFSQHKFQVLETQKILLLDIWNRISLAMSFL